ncbi:hypothetical protein [Xenorhabdus vietnamensis]|uniref:hypothetical protein n=1 Tax=Xenorhabdus vietnamensis TaxID=351656 RepID=UPI00111C64DD|nr:hypothetical protein [Xenorhabdus vietnamensis]
MRAQNSTKRRKNNHALATRIDRKRIANAVVMTQPPNHIAVSLCSNGLGLMMKSSSDKPQESQSCIGYN